MQSSNEYGMNRPARAIFAAACAIAIGALTAAAPLHAAPLHTAPPPPACPMAIKQCGCTITQSKIYTVANNLSASATQPNCIEIAKNHAILNLKGFRVIGKNTGIGILIRNGADHVIVEGGDEAENDPPQNPTANEPADSPNTQAVVSKWNIGIEDDADDAIIELFNSIGGEHLLPGHSDGNATAGVFLNQVKNSVIGDFRASFNGKYGVMLKHCSKVEINNVTTEQNGDTGIWLDSSNNNRIGPATSPANGKLGTWLSVSSDNVIHDAANASNSDSGLVVGCGLEKKNCPASERSNHNRIVNGEATGNKNAGVLIRKHSGGDIITVNHNDGNGGEKMDMVDENNKCDSNLWYNNTGSGNQDCIH